MSSHIINWTRLTLKMLQIHLDSPARNQPAHEIDGGDRVDHLLEGRPGNKT